MMEYQEPAIALTMPQKLALAHKVMDDMVRDALRYRWLRDEANSEDWERATHATPGDTDAEVDAMMVCR